MLFFAFSLSLRMSDMLELMRKCAGFTAKSFPQRSTSKILLQQKGTKRMENSAQDINRQALILANRSSSLALTILESIIFVAYLLEGVKGNRTWGYIAMVVLMIVVNIVLIWTAYKRNPASPMIKHLIAFGYAVFYTFLLFTAANDLVFTYVIPMLIIVSLYNDHAYMQRLGVGVIAVNILSVIVFLVTNEVTAQKITSIEIQILLVIVIIIYLIMSSKVTIQTNAMKNALIEDEKNHVSGILDKLLEISGHMINAVEDVSGQMTSLEDSMEQTLNSMREVSSGTNESAEAIQSQLVKTEEIQEEIQVVTQATDIIAGSMTTTTDAVSTGMSLIGELNSLTETSEKAGHEVADVLKTFQDYTSRMNSITDLITNVADQTSLLALNASIEAARAGDAGRGFAVVATEIGNLANQTTSATEDITSLIGNINSELQVMVDTIENLIETNQKQAQSAEQTSESFRTISSNVEEIRVQSEDLTRSVTQLAVSNKAIIDSIQTISAITEEVSAHSNETYAASQQNQEIVRHVGDLVNELHQDARKLQEET